MQLSWPVKRPKPLIDCHQNLNQLNVDECVWEGMRVDPLSSSFDQALSLLSHKFNKMPARR